MNLLVEQIKEYAGVETICEDKTTAFVAFVKRHGYNANRLKSGLNSNYNTNGNAADKALYDKNGKTCNKSKFRAEARELWGKDDPEFDKLLDDYLSHFNQVGYRL